MKKLVIFALTFAPLLSFAPHYTTYGGTSYDIVVIEQIRAIAASSPVQKLQRLSPEQQIDGIRSWLSHGPGRQILTKLNRGGTTVSPEIITDLARDMGIDVNTAIFRSAIKSYQWNRPPPKLAGTGSKSQVKPWWH